VDKASNKLRRVHRKLWLLKRRRKIERHKKRRKFSHLKSIVKTIEKMGINKKNAKNVAYEHATRRIKTIVLPESLNFNVNYEETVNHLGVIRKAIENNVKISRIDFSKIKEISTAAALVLASLVDQWRERVRGKIKADLPTWDASLIKLLKQMGFFDLLSLPKPIADDHSSSITYVPFQKGRVGEKDAGKRAKYLREQIEEITKKRINRHYLFEGLSEAITNTCHHAYPGVTDEQRKYWWLTGSFDEVENLLQITFYDRGVGIPKTLPAHSSFEKIKDAFGQWSDSKKIKAAMEIGRTSSGLPERGKGLQNLIEFAKSYPKGCLRITSMRGTYSENYIMVDGEESKCYPNRTDHLSSIGGTLIQWSVNI
jgi:hypothetical protein